MPPTFPRSATWRNGLWDWLEQPLKPFARWVGFRSDFPYKKFITDLGLEIQEVQSVNLFGLSRLLQIRRGAGIPGSLGPGPDVAAGDRTAPTFALPSISEP